MAYTHGLKYFFLFFVVLSLFGMVIPLHGIAQPLSASARGDLQEHIPSETHSFPGVFFSGTASSNWFDVVYYRLALRILPPYGILRGRVTVSGMCRTASPGPLVLDLANPMTVDSLRVDGFPGSFIHQNNSLEILLPHSYSAGEYLTVEIVYSGSPVATGFGSFAFDAHAGTPWVYTLSEPSGAKDWWPCKDDPSDKADSADILITCDSTLKAASQGKLVSVIPHGDGTVTYEWKERYPIASYLISVALTNYSSFSNWFRYSETDSMEILNYVLPEHYSSAQESLPRTVDMLKIFSNLFGLYPFILEKYGHAEFGWGGAMEHQTMSSMGTFNELTVAHELAHQWFGDMITCRTWKDLWLNEGFAQYATALYLERKYGFDSYRQYMDDQMTRAINAKRALGNPDTTTAFTLFDGSLVYAKGACFLHMLRRVLGDSVFFQSLHAYANDPGLKYATAETADFQSICETISGRDLNFFFDAWIYGEGFPVYDYSWIWNSTKDSSVVLLDIEQSNYRTTPIFFTMPIDIRLTAGGKDTTITIWNNAQRQRFSLPSTEPPSDVVLDPGNWILKLAFVGRNRPPQEYVLQQNYPNPFGTSTTFSYQLRRQENVTLTIFDILGRIIAVLPQGRQTAGEYRIQWTPPQTCGTGFYFYRLSAGTVQLNKKMVLLRN